MVNSLVVSTYTIVFSAKKDNIISSFPIYIHFVSISCINAVDRTSNTMLKSGDERRGDTLALFLILVGEL